MSALHLQVIPDDLVVARLSPDSVIEDWMLAPGFCSVTRTAEELSVVCAAGACPEGVQVETGWRALQVRGPLPFQQVGVLADLSAALAAADISIFVVSTFDTDYLLVKQPVLEGAIDALRRSGHEVACVGIAMGV